MMHRKIEYFSVLLLFLLFPSSCVQGKLLRLGGTWNREFGTNNLTVESYIEQLTWKAGNATEKNGLNFEPSDYSFKISESVLGLNLKGDVNFNDGVVAESGTIVKANFASEVSRSNDLKSASILLALSLDKLSTVHHLKTKMEENNATGSVQLQMKNINFIFEQNYTFASGVSVFKSTDLNVLEDDIDWVIVPRTVATYAIELIMRRHEDTNVWYKSSLLTWQEKVLAPLLVEQTKGLQFPVSSN